MALKKIAKEIKDAKENIFLVYAFNATGKTRLSTAYKEIARNEDTQKYHADLNHTRTTKRFQSLLLTISTKKLLNTYR